MQLREFRFGGTRKYNQNTNKKVKSEYELRN